MRRSFAFILQEQTRGRVLDAHGRVLRVQGRDLRARAACTARGSSDAFAQEVNTR